MTPARLLGIYREQIFSPGKIQDDAAVLDATLEELSSLGWQVEALRPEAVTASIARPENVLTMAQSDRLLGILEGWEARGTRVINSVGSIRNCYRKPLIQLLFDSGIPMPPSRIAALEQAEQTISRWPSDRLWLKRGDVHAIQTDDVTMVTSGEEIARALDHYRDQGIRDVLIQEHVEGPVVKFYGVGRQGFFKAYLASSGEEICPVPETLSAIARHAARAAGLEVYGGDAVLTDGGSAVLIDLNDWPSFSRCFRSAAGSIAAHVTGKPNHAEGWSFSSSLSSSRT